MTTQLYAEAVFSNLPLQLVLVPAGKRVAIIALAPGFCWSENGYRVFFDAHGYGVDDTTYEYGTLYGLDSHPGLSAWLTRQNIQIVGYGHTIIAS